VVKKTDSKNNHKNSKFSRKDIVVSDEEDDYAEANGWGNSRSNYPGNEDDVSSEENRTASRPKWSKSDQVSTKKSSNTQMNLDDGDDDYRSTARKNALSSTNIVRNTNIVNEDITLNLKQGSKGQADNNNGANSGRGNRSSNESNITNIQNTNINRTDQSIANDFFDENGDDDNGDWNGGRSTNGKKLDNYSKGNSLGNNQGNSKRSAGGNNGEMKKSGVPSNSNPNTREPGNPKNGSPNVRGR
jgi:hypothetical protein